MIVCSCNVISDHDVRVAVTTAKPAPRSTGDIFACLRGGVQCGRCATTIREVMDEALGRCPAQSLRRGSPHLSIVGTRGSGRRRA